jgi:bifunctional ADP-heptose synthase (sugar kinase/adenylyltransferase)
MKIDTLCVQGGWQPKKGEPRQVPIYSSTTFKYETTQQMGDLFDLKASGYFYTRLANPTNDKVAKKIDVLCVCDQMPFGCITEAVRTRVCELGAAGLTVIVDSRDRIGLYSNAIVKPNEIEASRVFKGKIKATDFEKLAKTLEIRTGRPAIVTAGEKGCYVSANARVTHVPACKVTGEIDFCGAGDTFLSCLACATAAGFPLVDASTLACAASAVTIKKLRTTGTATRAELLARLRA